jgi:ABC-type branched-subunit amino acid transport system ATPase component/ABC-type branched-subunit amino acid transport system permease subunit
MEIVLFMLLGIGTGGVYAMLAQGITLIYRGSGLLNFAQGALAMVGAFAYYECTTEDGLSPWVGLIVALVLCATIGALIHLVVLRRMKHSSPLSRVIATLGITIVLQSAAYLRYGYEPHAVNSIIPTRTVHIFSNRLGIGLNVIGILVIGLVLTLVLTVAYRKTSFGRVTTAVAEKQRIAASLGHSPDLIASVNWALGGLLAGLGGVLVAPILFLEPSQLVLLVLPAMSAALLGGFASFPITFIVSVGLGVAQSLIGRYVSHPDWSSAAPFIVVVLILIVRGQVLPLRSDVLDRLPAVGSGRVRYSLVAVLFAVGSYLTLSAGPDWANAMTTTLSLAIVCMSIVVITGYAGQLSLAQSVIAGIGALVAAKADAHVPFILALLIGAGAAAGAGALIGIPALRTRGVTLAIATLGLGSALIALVLTNTSFSGGLGGIAVRSPRLFGWSIDPLFNANRYSFVVLTVLVLVGLGISNLRRGATGRQLLALRSNERAAASIGLPSSTLKAYAFVLSAFIAGIGGVLLAFAQPTVIFNGTTDDFSIFASILIMAMTVAGGVGFVGGAIIGSLLIAGGIISQLLSGWHGVNNYLPLIGGVGLILVLMQGPDGLFEYDRLLIMRISAPIARLTGRCRPTWMRPHHTLRNTAPALRIEPKALTVTGLSVAFGGIKALENVDLVVEPGKVHGLIGPNGAGKTTLIDAVTGFVRSHGTVVLGRDDVSGQGARRRARAGISRSFQSLELFNELTIFENLVVAGKRHRPFRYVTDLLWPGRPALSAAALEALKQFELTDLVDQKPDAISFGQRKAVAIARAIASSPSVLLLDEPAAGLNDREAGELARLIRTIADEWKISVLLVEHKVDMVMSVSDHVTVLESGGILASGTPSQVMSQQAVIDAYLGTSWTSDRDDAYEAVPHPAP